MATDWIVPTSADVQKYLDQYVIDANNKLDSAGAKRLDGPTGILASVVAKIRGAIYAGGTVQLSATAGSVPPEAMEHVMVMCIPPLAAGLASPMAKFVDSDMFKGLIDEAREFLKLCREGMAVQEAPDASGGGGQTAVTVINPGDRLTRDVMEGL